jgi:predicted ArsR family transcriptional regulator
MAERAKDGRVNSDNDLAAVALLSEPLRLELYRYVRAQGRPVGRAEAADAVGIAVKLAAFHLDRLVDAGMLEFGYLRLSGRAGPGAGRPAKVYAFSGERFDVSFPQTRYSLAASIMATALTGEYDGTNGAAAVQKAAGAAGRKLGLEVGRKAATVDARRRAVLDALESLGYEPAQNGPEVSLCNCIFADLADANRELVCGLNAALIKGLVEGADLPDLMVEPRPPGPGCCACIVFPDLS